MSLVSIYSGLVAATFVLGIKTGMILGTSWLKKNSGVNKFWIKWIYWPSSVRF